MSNWQPVIIHGSGYQPHMARDWRCDPAWDIYALYSKPDETLVSRDGSVTRAVFWNRHIDRRFYIQYPRTTREAPRTRSRTIGDPDREWQIVQEHRDRYLTDAGLTLDCSPKAIAKCLADTFKADSYFKDKPTCPTFPDAPRQLINPIEGLLYKSFCVGCAHAYAALADACGLACRTIGCGSHRVAEVLVDGRWHMVENSCRHEHNRGLEAYFPASFMDVTLHPELFADYMPADKATSYLKMASGQYHFMGGTWQSPPTLRFATSNAYALYPELEHWGFKVLGAPRLPMVLRAGGFYWENATTDSPSSGPAYLFHPFHPGDQLRQSVWLDKLDDMQGLEITIPFPTEPTPVKLSVEVGNWRQPLTEFSEPTKSGLRRCQFTVPTTALTGKSVNWITLTNESQRTLQSPFIPVAMEPYIEPLCRNTGSKPRSAHQRTAVSNRSV
ncbi:MAG: hypothetical protein PCFJNLEI_00542 [Verrucomicrobiae bacterium]|nr:hypothetical protein [Verrucomicrobiae bacterium]